MADITRYASGLEKTVLDTSHMEAASVAGGRLRRHIDSLETVSGDSSDMRYLMVRLPADAVISSLSTLHHDAISGLTNVSFGDDNDPDGLMSASSLAAAGSKSLLSAVNIASLGKRLWELLGYSEDPGGELELSLYLNSTVSVAGTVLLDLYYSID